MDDSVEGVLNLDKPSGMTSRRVVDRVASLVPKVKVGHAGTLDPLASGVLIVCVGTTTRLIEWVQRMRKSYRAVIRLGARSNTLDADGVVEEVAAPQVPTEADLRGAIISQVGLIRQRPPEYSALRVKGRRAYALARSGQAVVLEPRVVRIDRVELRYYHWPLLELEIDCGGGTYIRSIARDLGDMLGCGGLIESLVRTRIGSFTLEDSSHPDGLTAATLHQRLQPSRAAVSELPAISLDEAQLRMVAQGRSIPAPSLPIEGNSLGEIALLGCDGRLAALGEHDVQAGLIHPRKVMI
jgi:tRNA pseudouridine55 synthase